MIFDLSEIETKAAILPNWENYKPDCVFHPNFKKTVGALVRLAQWHRGNTQKQKNVENLEKGLDTKSKEKIISREGGYRCNKRGNKCGGST
jgi:hypothetical protein